MDKNTEQIKKQREGIKLSVNNSDNLFQSAELLSNNGFNGLAISLLILSAEESVKSFALSLELMLGSKSEVKNIIGDSKSRHVDSYLFIHEDKHKLAKAIIKDLRSISSPWFNLLGVAFPKYKKHFDFFSLSSRQCNEIEQLLIDFDGFNNMKNRGLYVDYLKGIWKTPLDLNIVDYKSNQKKIALIRGIFSPRIKYFLELPDKDLGLLMECLNDD